ncbi:phosphinothricin N-acetyltransferase [Cytophagales bacterium WSM2-2]|nr:phosphinothricin N-acetyltransferase [Cytophagales bacterium WSM2-2]
MLLAMKIHPLLEQHYKAVADIYTEGINTGNATFETGAVDWSTWDKNHLSHSRLIAQEEDKVIGWAAISPVSGRCVYGGVAEVSVYVRQDHRGKGVGKALLLELIRQSEANGIWTLQSGIFPENASSIKIHEQCGFRIVGYREKVGKMNGIWRNTVLLEKRSAVAGI